MLQMETMRECCSLALMLARQREQHLMLACDRALAVIDRSNAAARAQTAGVIRLCVYVCACVRARARVRV